MGDRPRTWRDYLRSSVVSRRHIDDLVAGRGWARFDPELGYVLGDSAIDWGLDGTRTIETFDADGARAAVRYPGVRSRIHCFGDAFTEGTQVSDGETWEEYLAGHLGEPVGNYGVGVYGLYQAYRRMRRVEGGRQPAEVLILYVLSAGITLGVTRSAWYSVSPHWRRYALERGAFHGTLWPSVEMDLETGRFVERENPLRTAESLYRLCDPEWLAEALDDDLGGQLHGFLQGFFERPDLTRARRLADALGTHYDPDAPPIGELHRLHALYARRAAVEVLDLAAAAAASRGQRLLVALNLTQDGAASPEDSETREHLILGHLRDHEFAVFDMAEHHRAGFAKSALSYRDYLAEFATHDVPDPVTHPNAHGNHLFAYAIKDSVLALLDQKPVPYDPSAARPATRAHAGLVLPAGVGDDAPLTVVLRALHVRYAEPWTADSLARLARRSRSSLYAQFLSSMKVTPMEYLKHVRLDEAARLLRETDDLVASVATRVGFSSPFHFSREFARRFGVPPSRYRRRGGAS